MKITRLSMDGFGIFRGVDVPDLPSGLSLFLGDNEAGKSTTLGFVHTVLFGYPDGRSKEKSYSALNGGQSGGRLVVETERDGMLTIERRDGKKGGPVTITGAGGRDEGPAALGRILGGTTRNLYRNLYAFSLYELERMESLTDEEVRDFIYGASIGTGSRSFPEARKQLESRMGELFLPGGRKPEINDHLRQLKEVRDRIRDEGQGIKLYQEMAVSLAGLDAQILAGADELRTNRETFERLKAYANLWEDWVALKDAEEKLGQLPEAVENFPDDGIGQLSGLSQQIETQREELRASQDALAEKREKMGRLAFDEALLEKAAEIRTLVHGLGAFEKAVGEQPRAHEHFKSVRRQAEAVLVDFGAGWSEERVLALDRSSMVRGRIEEHARTLSQATARAGKAAEKHDDLGAVAEEAARKDKSAREKVAELQRDRIEVPLADLAALKERREQFHSVMRDLPRVVTQREGAARDLQDLLGEIGPAWTTATLDEFDGSLPARQKVTDLDANLSASAARERDAVSGQARAEKTWAAAEADVKDKQKELAKAGQGSISLAALREQKSVIRSLRDMVTRRAKLEDELQLRHQVARGLQPQLAAVDQDFRTKRRRYFGVAAAVLFVLALVSGPVLWFAVNPLVGSVVAGVFLVLSIQLFVSGRGGPGTVSAGDVTTAPENKAVVKQLQADLEKAHTAMDELKTKLDVTGTMDMAAVDELTDDNEAQILASKDVARLERGLEDLETARNRAAGELEDAVEAVKKAREEREALEAAWKSTAEDLSLPPATSPRVAGLVFEKVENARVQARQLADLDSRQGEMERNRDEYLDIMKKIPRLESASASGSDEQRLAALAEFLAEMDRQDEDIRLLVEARLAAANTAQELAAAGKRLEEAGKVSSEAAGSEKETRQAWLTWLQEQGMDQGWSPETCLRLLERAGRLFELAVDRDESAEALARHTADAEDFAGRMTSLCGELGRPQPSAGKLVTEVHVLESALEENTQQRTLHESLAGEIPDLEAGCTRRDKRIETLESKVATLIAAGGARDVETFRRRGQAFDDRKNLLEAMAGHASNVRKISGESDLEALGKELAGKELASLRADVTEMEGRVGEGQDSLDGRKQERTRIDERCKQLRDEDAISRLRAEEESLLEELRLRTEDWGRHAIALHLLTAAKERFEKAHQPEVIRRASHYFESITGGRYKQVFAPHGEGAMEVIDARDQRKPIEALSRGTAEQLYLAIRFGYIASHAGGGEKLPILMDDVLVNFDPTRASHAARGILEMASSHQVLFFTCHPEMVDIFHGHDPSVPVYKIGDGTITGTPATA